MTWHREVRVALDKVLATQDLTKIAVFDADGTLWHDDLGEAFFQYQIKINGAPGLKGISDPWAYYKDLCATDTAGAYGWLAQINAKLQESELLEQSRTFYRTFFKNKINPNLRALIGDLKQQGFEVWICTASIRWALAPAVEDLELSLDRLISAEVELDSKNRLTQKLIKPVPYRPGKKYWLEKRLPQKPQLVVGNSMGDLEMMGLATELPLTVIFKPHLPEIKESEEGLIVEATSRGWPIQIFQQ